MENNTDTKAWRTNTPCQNFKCEFYWGTNPDPGNNCRFIYLQDNCIDYKN